MRKGPGWNGQHDTSTRAPVIHYRVWGWGRKVSVSVSIRAARRSQQEEREHKERGRRRDERGKDTLCGALRRRIYMSI